MRPAGRFALYLAGTAVAVQASLSLWGLSLLPGSIDAAQAGTWGDWVSGAGAISAVWIALFQIAKEKRIANEQAAQAEFERRTRVRFWIVSGLSGDGALNALVKIENGTSSVIFEWALSSRGQVQLSRQTDGPLAPGTNQFVEDATLLHRGPTDVMLAFRDTTGQEYLVDESGDLRKAE